MSLTLQLVHVCDHSVPVEVGSKESVTFLKSNSSVDVISDKVIKSVDYIVDGELVLFKKQHFNLVGNNNIVWVMDEIDRPIENSALTIIFQSSSLINQNQSAEDCTRCGGNGWYSAPASIAGRSISTVSGVDKMIQDFLKVLLTDNRYYTPGTSLKSIVGQTSRSETDMKDLISMAIKEAEKKVKANQYEMLLQQIEISSDELLKSVIIDELEQLDTGDGYYVMLSLVNELSYALSIGLNL